MPNLTRLLARWGIEPYIKRNTMTLRSLELRRWEHGEYLGAATWMPEVESKHGAPQYAVHRADILKGITDAIRTLPNVTLQTNSRVVGVNMETPSVSLINGTTLVADVVVGADGDPIHLFRLHSTDPSATGVKSTCRKILYQRLGLSDYARPTGDAAFRAMIPLERIKDPALIKFVKTPIATRWIGPGRHVQGFPIRGHEWYNMVCGSFPRLYASCDLG